MVDECQAGAAAGAKAAVAKRWVLPFSAGSREMVELLGGKGANLAELTRLGAPIPPGFVITTEACRAFLADARLPDELMDQVRAGLAEIEYDLGGRFGAGPRPLLVSVRSGAPVSMPGMMETILNVGLTEALLDAFGDDVGDRSVAEDCLRRLRGMFEATVGEQAPDDAHAQLEHSIAAVFRSWNSKRAKLYRRYNRIPETGTAVVVQAMVFGNSSPASGTGVLFTRDPSTGDRTPFGDYLANAQGEDIVAGGHNTDDLDGMRASVPEAHAELLQTAEVVERHFADLCEIEFTVQDGRLWLLQSRAGQRSACASVRVAVQLAHEGLIARETAIARVRIEELDALLHPRLDGDAVEPAAALTRAIGASPGLASGRVVLDGAEATELAARGEPVVLVRSETRPDDLEGILACAGLLTTRGGKTSHAAVVTRGLGRPCVCGAEEVVIDEQARALRIGDAVVRAGDTISIDGDSGMVLLGEAPTLRPEPPAEVADLLAWCDERRRLAVAALATVPERMRLAIEAGADELVLAIAAHVDDVESVIATGLEAAGNLPVTVLTAAEEPAAVEEIVAALMALRRDERTALVVPAVAWPAAAAAGDRLSVLASTAPGTTLPRDVPVGAVTWEEQASGEVLDLPSGVPLALPPDLGSDSLALVRRLGARAMIVPADRVAVARLALARDAA